MKKISQVFYILIIISLSAWLAACQSVALRPNRGATAISDMQTVLRDAMVTDTQVAAKSNLQVPKNINTALMPPLSSNKSTTDSADTERFNISVNNEPAQSFFMGLVKGTSYNIVVSPSITGNISLNLKNVTIPEVLEAVHDAYGYDFERTNYGFRVNPPGLETRIFSVNYLDIVRNGSSGTVVSSGGITGYDTEGSTSTSVASGTSTTSSTAQVSTAASQINTTTALDVWKTLQTTLETMIGKEGGKQVIVDRNSGTIAVTAYPAQLKEVAKYLDAVQNTMTREVLLDAKVLEVTLNKDYQAGIQWNILGFKVNPFQTFTSDGSEFLKDFTQILTLQASTGGDDSDRFTAVLHALSNQGNVQVLSSPRVATLNNQQAVIKIGNEEFFVTNVSSSTLGSAGGTDTTQNIELTPFFSGIALEVTPQISADGDVTLQIHPIVSQVTEKNKAFIAGGETQDLPLAFSTLREADTIVHAKNGQIIVIGGLMENSTQQKISGVPFLDKTPFLGTLFRRTEQESVKSELVILLRPTVIQNSSWQKRLKILAARFKSLDEGFYVGPHPEVFGNLGETEGYRN